MQLERLKREVRNPDAFLGNLIHLYYTQDGAISPVSELSEAVSYGLIYLVKGRSGGKKKWYLDEVAGYLCGRINLQDIVIEAILKFMKQNGWSVTTALLKQMASMNAPDAEGKLFDKIIACR